MTMAGEKIIAMEITSGPTHTPPTASTGTSSTRTKACGSPSP
jgi:hypothetical protein